MHLEKQSKYERPSMDMAVLDELPMICVSGNGSNGEYSEIDIDWDDEQ